MSDLKVTEDLTKAIQTSLNPAEMAAAVQYEIQKQENAATDAAAAQAVTDKAAADKAAADAAAVLTTGFSRTENIGGREFTFEAASELELERMVNNALKVAYAVQTTEAEPAPVITVDPAVAQKAEEEKAAAKAELELQFKRGEISAADYIEKSGAVTDYLAKQGVPLESLKAAVNQNQNSQFEQDWASATETFKKSPAGSDWPGGEKNRYQLGMTIQALGLVDAVDKVAALAQAYDAMKQSDTMFPGEAEEEAAKVAAAAPPAAVAHPAAVATPAATVTPKTASASSALFGRSSGTGAVIAAIPAAATIDIPADATPAEILDAWKKSQVAGGRNPDDAFKEQFSVRRA